MLLPSSFRVKSRGFTILEMLVVLIIIGFITSILFQALDQIYKLQSRFGMQLAQSQQGAMYTDWYRQVVQGMQVDFANGTEKFKGSETQFTGTTTSPLSTEYGTPKTVSINLQYDRYAETTELLYVVGDQKMKLFSWDGGKNARFTYVDTKGEQHDTWPPEFGLWPQLPSMILLHVQRDREPLIVAAVPRGTQEPKAPTAEMGRSPL